MPAVKICLILKVYIVFIDFGMIEGGKFLVTSRKCDVMKFKSEGLLMSPSRTMSLILNIRIKFFYRAEDSGHCNMNPIVSHLR